MMIKKWWDSSTCTICSARDYRKIAAFIVLSAMIVFGGCAKIDNSTDEKNGEEHPDQEIWDGRIEVTNNGLLKSVVQAGYMQYFERERLTLLDSGVVVDFYDSNGEHSSVLTSQRAKIDERIDLFVASGNVVVTSDSGEILRTERLYWDKEQKRIKSDTLVVLLTDLDSLQGYEFESDENLTDWILKNPTGQTMRRKE